MPSPDIVVLYLDDIGKEALSLYNMGGITYPYANTPNINSIASNGVLFNRAYGQPICSPDRSSLLLGMYPSNTGVSHLVRDDGGINDGRFAMQTYMNSLPKALQDSGFATGAFGKYHVGNENTGGLMHPALIGFDDYQVSMYNIDSSDTIGSERCGYWNYHNNNNGTLHQSTEYHSKFYTEKATRWYKDKATKDEPIFLYLSMYATHVPIENNNTINPVAYNSPPSGSYNASQWTDAALPHHTTNDHKMHAYRASFEAADYYFGKLLNMINSYNRDTIFIVLSDNGTPGTFLGNESHPVYGQYDHTHGKNTPYELGIGKILIVSGPDTKKNVTCNSLVDVVDVYATLYEILGLTTIPSFEGYSFSEHLGLNYNSPVRDFSYSESFLPMGLNVHDISKTTNQWAVSGPTASGEYKLVKPAGSNVLEMYRLVDSNGIYNPMEQTNLIPNGNLSGLASPELQIYNTLLGCRALIAT